MNQPLIKWTGSKRYIAKEIVSHFPDKIDTYYEPFIGGGSVLFELLRSGKKVDKYVVSDINEDLINVYKLVQLLPQELILGYTARWIELKTSENRKEYYYSVRDNYNKTKCPIDFFFLTRTCYNGLIRYNQKGEFNVGLHFSRNGIHPDKMIPIILYYHELLKNVEFKVQSYENVNPKKGDVIYLDPPYDNSDGIYFGNITFNDFENYLFNLSCSWFLNFNGKNATNNEREFNIEYDGKTFLGTGNSSFSRLKGHDGVKMQEYFYWKLDK